MDTNQKWYERLFGRKAAVEIPGAMEGGIDILRKLVSPELAGLGNLEQYNKSLYVFACVSKIAEKVSSIDLQLYKVLNSRGDMKELPDHALLDLLYRPNQFQTKIEFWKTTIINLKTTGDAFWFKVRNKGGKVVELWNLRPDLITIVTDPVLFIKEYQFMRFDGVISHFAPSDIIHFKYPNPLSDFNGASPLSPARLSVQTERYASEYQRDFFLNSARPDAIIKSAGKVKQDQKDDLREGWNKMYKGPGNSSKIAILSGGLEYQQISLSQQDMDYIEGKKMTRDDILTVFKVPKPLLAIVDDVNRANSETAMYIFLAETIVPDMHAICEKINEELVEQDFGKEFYIDFKDPTPANRESLMTEYEKGVQNNWLLINEVRQREGLPPIKGGWSIYMPIVNQAVGGLPQADAVKALAKMYANSDENEATMQHAYEERMTKHFNFKGHSLLKMQFELVEAARAEVLKVFAAKKKAAATKGVKKVAKKGAKKNRPIIVEHDKRVEYAKMINRTIDATTAKLKDATNSWAMGQKARVIKNLDAAVKKFDVARRKNVYAKLQIVAKEIMDLAAENTAAIEFIVPYLEAYLVQSGQEALAMIAPAEDFNVTNAIQKVIQKRAKEFAESVNSTTLDKLDATLAEGIAGSEGIADLTDRVSSVYEDFPLSRSEMIARTEATNANNTGLLEGFKQSGVATGKEWINAGDDRVRPEHQDVIGVGGEIVALDGTFSNGLSFPQEPNCRCVLGPAFLE